MPQVMVVAVAAAAMVIVVVMVVVMREAPVPGEDHPPLLDFVSE